MKLGIVTLALSLVLAGCSSDGQVGEENGRGSGGNSGSGGSQSVDGAVCQPAVPNAGGCETCLANECCASYQACGEDQYCQSQLAVFRTCRANGGGHECCYELQMPNNPDLAGLFDCCYGQQPVCLDRCEPEN